MVKAMFAILGKRTKVKKMQFSFKENLIFARINFGEFHEFVHFQNFCEIREN